MTVCPKCKGKAEYFKEVFNDGKRRREILIKCNKCNGTGEVEMTNEEWLKSMNTEQFAEALAWIEDRGELPTVRKENVKAFEKWLKEIHNDSM